MSDIQTRQVTEEEFEAIDKLARPIIQALRIADAMSPGVAIQALTMVTTEIIVNARMRPGHHPTELLDHLTVAIRKSVERNLELFAKEKGERSRSPFE